MKRILTAQFPNLVTTPEQSFFDKYNTARPWERGNLVIHKEAVKSGVIDLYLLAATDLKVACPTSSFAKVARIIGEKYEH